MYMWVRLRVPQEDFATAVLFQPVPLHAKMLRLQQFQEEVAHDEMAMTGDQKEKRNFWFDAHVAVHHTV